jgi:hypothetical protein
MWFKQKLFQVKIIGRAGLIYKEDGKSLLVDSEMLAGGEFDIVIFSESIKNWQPPNETEYLSDEDKTRIKTNITKELSNLRIDWK